MIDADNLLLVCATCHRDIENGKYPHLKRSKADL